MKTKIQIGNDCNVSYKKIESVMTDLSIKGVKPNGPKILLNADQEFKIKRYLYFTGVISEVVLDSKINF